MDEFRSRVASLWRSSGTAISSMAGPFKVVEGTYQPVRLAMLEFPTMDQMCLAATVSHGFFMTGAYSRQVPPGGVRVSQFGNKLERVTTTSARAALMVR